MEKTVEKLRETARELGFEAFGTIETSESESTPAFRAWLNAGRHAGMGYLAKNADAFENPRSVLPGVRSIFMLGMTYETVARLAREFFPDAPVFSLLTPVSSLPTPVSSEESGKEKSGKNVCEIAAFARTGIDYHVLIRRQMKRFQQELSALFPGQTSRGVVDSAPLHEREFARRAGLGFQGRNRMLIRPDFGSTFFLAAVLTTVEISEIGLFHEFSPDQLEKFEKRCTSCGKCQAACPTGALSEEGLEAGRCGSYLTIENRDGIPSKLRPSLSDCVFGCDACQRACPWNAEVWSRIPVLGLPRDRVLAMDESEFRSVFEKTPFLRAGLEGLRRNFED